MSSLFELLVAPAKDDRFAATALSRELIHAVAKQVCSFRRNTQVSYRVVELYGLIHQRINGLIETVENGDGAWEAYDTYTSAIDPLEESLFNALGLADLEQQDYLTETKSVADCITFISTWAARRNELRNILKFLRGNGEEFKNLAGNDESDAEITAAFKHDDDRFLTELIRTTMSNKREKLRFRSRSTIDNIVNSVMRELVALETRLVASYEQLHDDSISLCIQIAMLIYGITELILNEALPEDWRSHARSEVIWKGAESLVKSMRAHMERAQPGLSEVKTEYDAFIRLLMGALALNLPANFLELMKHVGKIPRSYYARALCLVALCRELATQFEATNHTRTATELEALEAAIAATIEAMTRAKQPVGAPVKYELDAATTQEFSTASQEILQCFDVFKLGDRRKDITARLEESAVKDQRRLAQVQEKLQPRMNGPEAPRVTVTVKIHPRRSTGNNVSILPAIDTSTYTVLPTTRLSAIQFQASRRQYRQQSLPQAITSLKASFTKADQFSELLSMDRDVASIAGAGNACQVALLVWLTES